MILSNFTKTQQFIVNKYYNGISINKNYDIPALTKQSTHSHIVINSIYKESAQTPLKCNYTLYDFGKRYIIRWYGNSNGSTTPCKEYYNYADHQEFDDLFDTVINKYIKHEH